MPFQVVIVYWHENSVGEQGNGPPIVDSKHATREAAEARATVLRANNPTTDYQSGASTGAWVYVKEIPEKDN